MMHTLMYSYTSEQVYENTIRTVNCPSDALSLGQLLLSGVLFTDVCGCVCLLACGETVGTIISQQEPDDALVVVASARRNLRAEWLCSGT